MRRRIGFGVYFGTLAGAAVTVGTFAAALSVMPVEVFVRSPYLPTWLYRASLATVPLWGVGGGIVAYLTRPRS